MSALGWTWTQYNAIHKRQNPVLRMTKNDSGSHHSAENVDQTVCVLGGGFGGLYCALALSAMSENEVKGPKPKIMLFDKKERFVFLPLLYELCVGDASIDEVAPTYESLLQGTNIEFVQKDINCIDVEGKRLLTETDAETFQSYGSLVIATGTEATFNNVPGASGYALPFYTIEDCFKLRRQLSVLDTMDEFDKASIEVVIVGAGYSGVELALNIGQRIRESQDSRQVNVYLVHRGKDIMPSASQYNRESSLKGLEAANVTIMTETSVVEVKGDDQNKQVILKNNEGTSTTIDSDILLWTAGNKPSNSVTNSNLTLDKMGRIVTGKTLRVTGVNDIFAVGDCSRAALEPFPATAQVAMQQAQVAAFNVLSVLTENSNRKTKLLPFKYLDLGEMLTLGTYDATINSFGGLLQLQGPSARYVFSDIL